MRRKILKIIESYLQFLARWKVRRAKPKIVAISGSYGKTLTKEAVFLVLSKKFGKDVGKNWGNMNSTLGLPLAILGLKNYTFGAGFLLDLIKAKWGFFFHKLPKILVLELGIDKPGEMGRLLKIVTPNIAVITGISETHLEGFMNIDGVKKEKELLLHALPKDGIAIISADDENSKNFEISEGVKIIFVGKSGDISYSNLEVSISGTTFDLKIGGQIIQINSKLLGRHQIQALLIASAVAKELGVEIEKIKSALEEIMPEKGRMNPLKIKNGIVIIDDSYNSNPKSAEEALSTLSKIKYSGRKVAVLGNMNELGSYEKEGHLRVGRVAGKIVDLLIAVGDNAQFIARGAKESENLKNQIVTFKTTDEAIREIKNYLHPTDLVLVKGSQNRVRLEKLIKYLIDDDKFAEKVLVRQERKWENR
ncbi:MAG: UDP-N-acetylmuramoyl-tripeptide--D-alanyl-D-alanine ligase [Candidatus Berkelbacteria bacterium Athens1014_28]|uniref:UDP-N-acetylmuramoyl-tripeptide--D-alanyl-D-alanine ligase n=1 Tax=Candidatus Berkelbacteria bacterium Athens1014_28 TaxID=2017145 RepID=A0A554LM47_9BACT|nr:MAG: UDP-N-acetylmuramoyl-tripeptide--D-alanyl-D-alanine ligase [Candidatus Berkelbacteria bacterium Athens1014_28]